MKKGKQKGNSNNKRMKRVNSKKMNKKKNNERINDFCYYY